MGFLERLENLIQGAVEGGTSSVLRNKLKPVEIETQLERAMRDNAQTSRGGRLAPTAYTVWLHPDTYRETIAGVEGYNHHCEMLLNQFAMQNGYTLLHQRISVSFDADASLGRRDIHIETAFAVPPAAAPTYGAPSTAALNQTQVISVPRQESRWHLRVVQGGQSQVFQIPEGISRVGRASDADIILKDDANTVSRQHAVINRYGEEIRLRDVGSKNGTKVNGNYVPSHLETLLSDGAEIAFGQCIVRIERR